MKATLLALFISVTFARQSNPFLDEHEGKDIVASSERSSHRAIPVQRRSNKYDPFINTDEPSIFTKSLLLSMQEYVFGPSEAATRLSQAIDEHQNKNKFGKGRLGDA